MPWRRDPKEPPVKPLPPDDPLVQFLVSEVRRTHGVDVSNDRGAMSRIGDAVAKARASLSSGSSGARVLLPFLTSTANKPVHFEAKVTREDLAQIDGAAPLPSEATQEFEP
jgi:molecular chaperone DnaK